MDFEWEALPLLGSIVLGEELGNAFPCLLREVGGEDACEAGGVGEGEETAFWQA